mmetsp:Transcript_24599/g.44566  ORF Transcript_24599/g.44566 Transcript_24599/m.44566 type:complete len:481 (-) Transcript_24599:748-2190(-)
MLDALHGVFSLALCEWLRLATVLQRSQHALASNLCDDTLKLCIGCCLLLSLLLLHLCCRLLCGRTRHARLLLLGLKRSLSLCRGCIGLRRGQTAHIHGAVQSATLMLGNEGVIEGIQGKVHFGGHEIFVTNLGRLIVLIHTLLQHCAVQADPVADLIVVVIGAKLQQEQHVPSQASTLHGNLRQGIHGCSSNKGVLQNHSIVDEADVFGWLARAGHLLSQEAQDAGAQVGILAVLDELAEMQQANLSGRGHLRDDKNQRIDEVLFDLSRAVFAEVGREEGHEHLVLGGVQQAQTFHCPYDLNLEDVANVRHEASDLLHQSLHIGLVTCLQQRCESQRCGVAVLVREEWLHVTVAPRGCLWSCLRQHVQRSDGSEADHRLRGRKEDLEDCRSMRHIIAEDGMSTSALGIHGRKLAEGPCSLVGDHLALMAQAAVQVRHQGLLDRGIPLGEQRLRGISDEQALCHGALHLTPRHACDDLMQG